MVSEQHSALYEGLYVANSRLFESDSVWACNLLHLLCGTYEMASTDTVSNAGLVHITGAGTCIVVVSQAGNTNYVGSMAAPEKEHTISINQVATTRVTSGAVPFIYPALR